MSYITTTWSSCHLCAVSMLHKHQSNKVKPKRNTIIPMKIIHGALTVPTHARLGVGDLEIDLLTGMVQEEGQQLQIFKRGMENQPGSHSFVFFFLLLEFHQKGAAQANENRPLLGWRFASL